MHDVNIGSKPGANAKRDAIHFAVAPVISADRFLPGEHVGLNEKGEAAQVDNPIGIIDPFLKLAVEPGEPVWIMLYPKTVQNLRHDWDHPAFDGMINKKKSEEWLKDFAIKTGYDYAALIETASTAFTTGSAHGRDDSTADLFNENRRMLSHHISVVTGKIFNEEAVEAAYFSCAC